MRRTLPRPEALLVDRNGRPSPEWWRFFSDLTLQEDAVEPEPVVIGSISGGLSVRTYGGQIADGNTVRLQLDGDVLTPGDLQYYGTGASGERGFYDFTYSPNLVFVRSLSDLPAAIAGVISLEAGRCYFFVTSVDLLGARIECDGIVSIEGTSSETSSIYSTGLDAGTPLITSSHSLPIKFITITHGTALSLDASANPGQALDWKGVNFTDCASVGTIKGYNNVIWDLCALLNSANLIFDGTTNTVGFTNTLFRGIAGQATIILPATLTALSRFRMFLCGVSTPAGGTGINASTSATIPAEGYILGNVAFTDVGTPLAGITYTDLKADFNRCTGITNSTATCTVYISNNATPTVIGATGTFYKMAGTWSTAPNPQKFTADGTGRMTYVGARPATFFVMLNSSVSSGSSQAIRQRIGVNGSTLIESQQAFETTVASTGRAFSIVSQAPVTLNPGDYIEAFVANDTSATDITGENVTFSVYRLP